MIKMLTLAVALAAVALMVAQAGSKPRVELAEQGTTTTSNQDAPRLIQRACANCHSNQTNWPWYSHVPPVSWWIARDVREGRKKLNLSEWQAYSSKQKRDRLDSICGLVSTDRMPPWFYLTLHPEAKLNQEDKKAVCGWAKGLTIATATK